MRCHTRLVLLFLHATSLLLASVSCHNGGGGGGGGGAEPDFGEPPAQSIDLSLIGIHDPRSDDYDGDCIGCHGELLNQVAQDGVTPLAHSVMVQLHGANNERCIGCHADPVDFLAYSAGQVRGQVNVEEALCTTCHGGDIPGLTQFYVR